MEPASGEKSLAICTPSGRDPKWPYTFCLARLMGGLKSFARATVQIELGYATDMARNRLVNIVRKEGYTHVLFIDDDMSFPENCVERLLAHGKEIIAANYTNRVFPIVPLSGKGGQRVYSKGRTGLEEVDFAPTGMMLIDCRVFERMAMPWFRTTYLPDTPFDFMSDDVYFCEQARRLGYRVWIDHDLSNEIGHIGSFEFHNGLTALPEPPPPASIVDALKGFVAEAA